MNCRRENRNYIACYGNRTKIFKIPLFPSHTIITISRRRSIKTTKIFCENYEYTGHSLDTITYIHVPAIIRENGHSLLCQPTYFWTLYLSNISNIMYHKLYKRSAEKWQKVAILQKTQKKQKRQKSVYS